MLSDATLAFGEEFAELLLGLDRLYAAEQGKNESIAGGDIERLVVINMSTTHQPRPYASYADAMAHLTDLTRRAADLPESDRRLYYGQAVASAIAFATWRTQGLDFPDQIARFLHVPAEPASEAALDQLRSEMRRILTDLGYSGDLESQCRAWEERQRVPPDEVRETLMALLDEAWDRTAEIMTMPAEKSDGMTVETVSGVPYNAACHFPERTIRLNIDPVLTRPALKHLAVHEGYPGHYVQFKRRELAYKQGRGAADGLLSVVNTVHSTPFEGIADAGMSLIGWDGDLDGRLAKLMAEYRSGLGTRAAWRLAVDGWSREQTKDELAKDALVGGEGWVENRIRFISRPDRAALIWSYWQGERNIGSVWRRVADRPELHKAYLDWTYDRLHSVASHALFNPEA